MHTSFSRIKDNCSCQMSSLDLWILSFNCMGWFWFCCMEKEKSSFWFFVFICLLFFFNFIFNPSHMHVDILYKYHTHVYAVLWRIFAYTYICIWCWTFIKFKYCMKKFILIRKSSCWVCKKELMTNVADNELHINSKNNNKRYMYAL